MTSKIKNQHVQFRITDAERELLATEAKLRNLTLGQTARVVLFESLSGFDEKQEMLLRRLDKLEEQIEEHFNFLIKLCSIGAAAGALPLDADSQDPQKLLLVLRRHFSDSSIMGKNIVEKIKAGTL